MIGVRGMCRGMLTHWLKTLYAKTSHSACLDRPHWLGIVECKATMHQINIRMLKKKATMIGGLSVERLRARLLSGLFNHHIVRVNAFTVKWGNGGVVSIVEETFLF